MEIKFTGTAAVFGDTHNPFQDQRAIREVELFLGEVQPDLIIKLGDMCDFYGLSKFDKNPERSDSLQADLNSTKQLNIRQRKMCPDSRQIQINGNHEDRMRRFLWSRSPALASLGSLTIDNLYGLTSNEIEYVEYEEGLLVNGTFLFTHGDIVRAQAGYTARSMFAKHGGCGMHGHTHRLGSYYNRNRFGLYGWWENGCLCTLKPDWIQNPDWHQGFSLVHFTYDRFWVEQIQIINRRFM